MIRVEVTKNITTIYINALDAVANDVIKKATLDTYQEWVTFAAEKLGATRLDYIRALDVTFDDKTGIITLKGKWPNMLEKGFPAFDIKRGFAKSPKRHKTKDGGWYINVPYRHKSPTAKYGQRMPADIYMQAKQLRPYTDRLTGTEVTYPPRVSWTGYQHHSGIYENMIKVPQGQGKHQYFTFRRASNKSDPKSWWHPGFKGIKVAPSVRNFAEKRVEQLLKDSFR